ncbi:MAG: glycogen/starch/alpha-glucan phosphorylase [Clostridiales bacterium]|nr:glycogen/starch/alpha-glucan phosphorylase [Clostridiales bacterium]
MKLEEANAHQLRSAIGESVMAAIAENWHKSKEKHNSKRRVHYFSAEYLLGRMITNNLNSLGILKEVIQLLEARGIDVNLFEAIEDIALGNGGLGRLAACFLDSAATHEIPLDGHGLRYKYGLFKQQIKDGEQHEVADDWQRFGTPWCKRRDDSTVEVTFADQKVIAVPYDMPIIGYMTDNISTLRLWQSEAVQEFDFQLFNNFEYEQAVSEKNKAENITRVLYPNENSYEGKRLRLKQQYFLCCAGITDIVRNFIKTYGNDFSRFAELNAIQLNDTHPTVAIPELIRILQDYNLPFDVAFEIARKTFSYTNHTIMSEALESWEVELFKSVIPNIYSIIVRINEKLNMVLETKSLDYEQIYRMQIIQDNRIVMANLATFVSSYVNGVAQIHTEILKKNVLKDWYAIYPERFQNKTNGITQRRFLSLCNPELTDFIAIILGSNDFIKDLSIVEGIKPFINDATAKEFATIKKQKKAQLADFIYKREGVKLSSEFIFDIQVKRLHEYKRQLMNALSILNIYYQIKDGALTDFTPTAFIFGAKAAPGYKRAKGIIKFINEVATTVNSDPLMQDLMRVVFVENYNLSYAERIMPAADVSEQISPAGTEASGTGNMKLMLNGAVTLGTYDGANIEIIQQAGFENNYIFGLRVEDIEKIKHNYNPKALYDSDSNIKRVMDSLINGAMQDTQDHSFTELYNSILYGTYWHRPDHHYILADFNSYMEAKLKANNDYKDWVEFSKKCLMNIASAGMFSSDRTIIQYAKELWHV